MWISWTSMFKQFWRRSLHLRLRVKPVQGDLVICGVVTVLWKGQILHNSETRGENMSQGTLIMLINFLLLFGGVDLIF